MYFLQSQNVISHGEYAMILVRGKKGRDLTQSHDKHFKTTDSASQSLIRTLNKYSITQRLCTDLVGSVGATTAIQLDSCCQHNLPK